MIPDPSGAADAVILVDDAGAVTLFIGTDPEPRATATTNTAVIRILMDCAARTGRGLSVATRYPSGHRTLHRVEPDGTLTTRAVPPRTASVPPALVRLD
ncbi:hypothetical protein [Phytoactinopolyspora limicola]|uniref:hypothetical protein n=1 Tax=Phytoactinopolyspora limicola TaxID=2715536 RepID=UPI00140CBDE5|nr:hypothetical protein [Phytoactinopolyspora limicola]